MNTTKDTKECAEAGCSRLTTPRGNLCRLHYNRQFKPSIQKTCSWCQSPYFVYPGQITKRKYCSSHCKNLATVTHGHGRVNGRPSATYFAWRGMLSRCFNTKLEGYHRYGGRGITVCQRWLHSFENFLADMGVRPDGLTLDRINNDGNYEPENCRWATPIQQAGNKRETKRMTIDGVTHCIAEWARISGVSHYAITTRMQRGWDAKTSVFTRTRLKGTPQ